MVGPGARKGGFVSIADLPEGAEVVIVRGALVLNSHFVGMKGEYRGSTGGRGAVPSVLVQIAGLPEPTLFYEDEVVPAKDRDRRR
jgi:hypothetical protein